VDVTRLKRLPADLLTTLVVVAGFGLAVAGLYLLAGLAVTLLVSGVVVAAAGLVVDLD
jgi:hypothetical protein